jgi:hypothetical protein
MYICMFILYAYVLYTYLYVPVYLHKSCNYQKNPLSLIIPAESYRTTNGNCLCSCFKCIKNNKTMCLNLSKSWQVWKLPLVCLALERRLWATWSRYRRRRRQWSDGGGAELQNWRLSAAGATILSTSWRVQPPLLYIAEIIFTSGKIRGLFILTQKRSLSPPHFKKWYFFLLTSSHFFTPIVPFLPPFLPFSCPFFP